MSILNLVQSDGELSNSLTTGPRGIPTSLLSARCVGSAKLDAGSGEDADGVDVRGARSVRSGGGWI